MATMTTSSHAFCQHHGTETAPIKVLNDIRLSTDSGKITVLVLLYLSVLIMKCCLRGWKIGLDTEERSLDGSGPNSSFVSIGTYESENIATT